MKTETPTAVRPSETFLAVSFLGMLAGTIIAAAVTKSLFVALVGLALTIGIQRALVGGTKLEDRG